MPGHDQRLNFGVNRRRQNALARQLVLGGVRPSGDDLLRVHLAHAGQRRQFIGGRGIDIDERGMFWRLRRKQKCRGEREQQNFLHAVSSAKGLRLQHILARQKREMLSAKVESMMSIGWKMLVVASVCTGVIAGHAQCLGGLPAPPAICLGGVLVKDVPADAKPIAPIALASMMTTNAVPVYPGEALQAGVGGVVREAVLVNKEGRVEKVLATDGPEPLIPASTQAIRQWTFKPYLLNGEPTQVISTVYLAFKVGSGKNGSQVSVIPGMARISGGVAAGLLSHKISPSYPAEAKYKHISGTVILYAVIDAEGKPADLKVISGPAELRQATLDAAWQWSYKPFLLNGQPTAVETTITMNFNLVE
jgi:TonB family protein